MARQPEPTQVSSTVVLAAKDRTVWTELRGFCISSGIPLSQAVEDAVKGYLERMKVHKAAIGNVRSANG